MARSITLTLLLSLLPTLSSAAPVTFDFAATGVSGWYTFDAVPSVRLFDADGAIGPLRYTNAITDFLITLGQGDATITGSGGDLYLGVERGVFGESAYTAILRLDTFWRLTLNIWSPTDLSFLPSETLDAVPNIDAEDNFHEVAIYDTRDPGRTASFHWMTSLTRRTESADALRSTAVTVPEPATIVLLGFGLIGASLTGRRLRSSSPGASTSQSH